MSNVTSLTIIDVCLREPVCSVCGQRAPDVMSRTPAATAGRSPTHSWAATYPSNAPCIQSASLPFSCQRSFSPPIRPVQVLVFVPHLAGEAMEWRHWEGLRPGLLGGRFCGRLAQNDAEVEPCQEKEAGREVRRVALEHWEHPDHRGSLVLPLDES